MFYSHTILARKGPLGKIWLAAHFEKKLTKQQIFSTDISNAVQTLLDPGQDPLALRVSGHLMLGLVRIYSKKVKYLMIDCTDAMWKMQFAFQPGKVDIDAQNNVNVDDNRFYGNVSIDLDYPVLENIAFVSNLLPVSNKARSTGEEAHAQVRDLVSSQHSSIEFVRAGDDRLSLSLLQRPSFSQEKKASLGGAKFEDDLPIFDDQDLKLGDSFNLSGFQLSNSLAAMPNLDLPPFDPLELDEEEKKTSENLRSSFAKKTTAAPTSPTNSQSSIAAPAPKAQQPAKRRKVMEKVQIDDEVLKERMKDVSAIVRKRAFDNNLVPFSQASLAELSLEEKVYNTASYCEELRELALFASDRAPFPFPLKQPAAAPLPPPIEVARQRAVNTTNEDMQQLPEMNNSASFFDDKPPLPDLPENGFEEMKIRTPSLLKNESSFHRLSLPEFNAFSYDDAGHNTSIEHFEEHIHGSLEKKKSVLFSELTGGCNRRNASRHFLQILQLKTKGKIQVKQSEAYGDIVISAVKV